MKKWHWEILATLIVVGGATVIYWQGESCYAARQECISNLVMSSLSHKSLTPNEAASACDETQSYFCRVFSAANFPTILLVLIGAGGIWAALRTLYAVRRQNRSIHHQAIQVRKQTAIFNKSAGAAEKAAEAAMENIRILVGKERARIHIDDVDVIFEQVPSTIEGKDIDMFDRINFKILCSGSTDAFPREAYADIWYADSPDSFPPNEGVLPINLRKVVSPKEPGIDDYFALDWLTDTLVGIVSPEKRKATIYIHFRAVIRYTDVFQTKACWEMVSHYIWRVSYWLNDGSEGIGRGWSEHHHSDTEREVTLSD